MRRNATTAGWRPEEGARRLLRGKALALVALVLASTTAVGLLSAYLSPFVEWDIPTIVPSVHLMVEGVPENASAGDVFTLVAVMQNNANRPTPAVLRFEVRNPLGIAFDEITVYADCGAEERVTSKTLVYYIGWHGPLLAPNGTAYAAGTPVNQVEAALGDAGHWTVVLREIRHRDPMGYESLVDPGTNASSGIRETESLALKALHYYGMASAPDGSSPDPGDWALTLPFADAVVATGGPSTDGFQVEISLDARGSYEFKFWAERPDGLGVPNHPWTCGEPL